MATRLVGTPAWGSMRYCSAAAVAAPPGMTRPRAFPASCDVATAKSWSVPSAMRCTCQMQTKLAAWNATIAPSHAGSMVAS